jgi:hypothetical protein|tara:strand:+ start:344 stop:1060 length:717 start_codon:yes stop_codon:yes gene_type:complete
MNSKYDDMLASMDHKEAAEFTRGDPERIKYMREVKANKKMQQQIIDYSPNKVTTTKSKPLVDVEKTLEKYEDDYVSKRGEQTIALANTAAKLKGNINKDDYILKEDGNGLMVNKNKTIAVRDSFVAKQFNRALGAETEATPEQFGKLAANLERNRQMQGKATNVNKFKKNFNKPVQKKPSEPFKFPEFKIDPVLPLSFFKKTAPDPELVRLEQKYNQMVSESNQPKGLPGILGIKKYD